MVPKDSKHYFAVIENKALTSINYKVRKPIFGNYLKINLKGFLIYVITDILIFLLESKLIKKRIYVTNKINL